MNRNAYTRQQLVNYLNTGDVNTPATGTIDRLAFASRTIDYVVQNNPTLTYQWIKNRFGKDFPNWMPNAELNPASMETMSKFIHRRIEGMSAAAAIAFIKPLSQFPLNTAIKNWTVPTDL